jgi:hypothetical protein
MRRSLVKEQDLRAPDIKRARAAPAVGNPRGRAAGLVAKPSAGVAYLLDRNQQPIDALSFGPPERDLPISPIRLL